MHICPQDLLALFYFLQHSDMVFFYASNSVKTMFSGWSV
jgi:hypothetical protein